MAGLGSYEGTGDYSTVHAQKRANAFLTAQSVSSTPLDMHGSPMKDFGISAAIAAIAASAKAAAATGAAKLAATGVGKAILGSKVGGAIVKGVRAVSKGVKAVKGVVGKVTKPIKQFTGKIFGKKAAIGNVSKASKGIRVKGAGTGAQWGSGVGKSQISSIASKAPSSFSTKPIEVASSAPPTTITPTSSVAPAPSAKGGFNVKAKIKEKATEFARSIPSRIKGSMDKSAAESEQQAQELMASASSQIASMPTIGDTPSNVQEEDLTSISSGGSSFAYNAKLRRGPFRMRGWSPFTKKNSPLAATIKTARAYLQSVTDKHKEQLVQQSTGAGFGVDPVTFQKIKKQ